VIIESGIPKTEAGPADEDGSVSKSIVLPIAACASAARSSSDRSGTGVNGPPLRLHPLVAALSTAAALAATPAVFTNPALYTALTPTLVKGIVVYHIMGTRAFTVNMPSTGTKYPTLLNSAVPTHPGVTLQATLAGPFTVAASVKGAVNASASNILLDPTPGTGKSDQNALNGVIHKIDQVLLPQ